MKKPWFKFYPRDWTADERLGTCSLTARGLWIEMISLMHRAEPYGHMLVNGKKPSDEQLASLVRAPVDIVRGALAELDAAGVFSRTRTGAIYSRRMVRDEKKSREGTLSQRQNGPLPGSRRSKQVIENTGQKSSTLEVVDLPPCQPPPTQRPEARVQKEKEKADFERLGFDRFWMAWPHKVSKADAAKAFAKALRRAKIDDIMAGVGRYVATKPDWQHWAHAATWLNGSRWQDAPELGPCGQATVLPEDATTSLWRTRVGSYRRTREWDRNAWGPAPGEPGCRAPPASMIENLGCAA